MHRRSIRAAVLVAMVGLTLSVAPLAALAAEVATARGQHGEAVTLLKAAVALQDDLAYIEPPAWFYPVRHDLGAVLLAAGRLAEAEAVYRENLAQYPNNGWSLFGLATSLREQGKDAEAAEVEASFKESWKRADSKLTGSRY